LPLSIGTHIPDAVVIGNYNLAGVAQVLKHGLMTTPDAGYFNSEFEDVVWDNAKTVGAELHDYIAIEKNRNIPSKKWLASLVYAFTTVAYKHKRLYQKEDFTSFWKPEIMKMNPMLDNITKIMYRHKFDRGIVGLRELREQGKVPDIIWKPWAVAAKYEHKPVGPIERVGKVIKGSGYTYMLLGIAAVYLFMPRIVASIATRKTK